MSNEHTHDPQEPTGTGLSKARLSAIQARADNLRQSLAAGELRLLNREQLRTIARGYDGDVLPLLAEVDRLTAEIERLRKGASA